MPDIRLIQDKNWPRYSISVDWSLLADGTLDDDQALATAVIVALGTNRLAQQDDILPDPDRSDRCGWWGDLDAEELWDGWPIGSRLWLLRRDKITPAGAARGATLARVKQYIREAIQPFVDHRLATRFEVEAERVGVERIDALVVLYRGPTRPIEMRFQVLWEEIEGA